jgi:hypothetical protein
MSLEQLKTDLINWHTDKYPNVDNTPGTLSARAITAMSEQLLLPVQQHFAALEITYGFTGNQLRKAIDPKGTAPDLDQHAASELNSKGKLVCERQGIACDFYIKGFESNMYEVAKWIAAHLPFDRMYLYGPDKPIHLSYGPDDSKFIQVMNTNDAGNRMPGKKGHAKDFDQIVG